jgi:hypothetical protein
MRSPRTPGAGIAGARKSLGGDDAHSTEAGPDMQRRYRLALHNDPAADSLSFLGRYYAAERFDDRVEVAS